MKTNFPHSTASGFLCTLFAATAFLGGHSPNAAAQPRTLKTEIFDRDPGWEALNNRMKPDPKESRTVIQDFGYSATSFAGGDKGEMGGLVQRSTTLAFYADRIAPKTLNDNLTASGKFLFTSSEGGAGIWFGWFRAKQEAGSARPAGGLGMNLDFERNGGRLAVRLSNDQNKFCGTFVTPYIPGKFRPAPLKVNTRYSWTLTYDPSANKGDGRFEFRIQSDMPNDELKALADKLPAELRARLDVHEDGHVGSPDFDRGTLFTVNLPPGFKQVGATFDHFGLLSSMKEGNQVQIYFDDLRYDGKTESFATDPKWDASGNRARFEEAMPTGYHDFGFSPKTNFAGGTPGEFGGNFWRLSKAYGYYADKIGPLTLDDPLEASGKVVLQVGTPDSEMAFGWFNSAQKEVPLHLKNGRPQEGHLDKTDNFLGVYLAGPSRLGRCLLPAVVTRKGSKVIFHDVNQAPQPTPNKIYDWTLKYDPSAGGGKGTLTVTLGEASATLTLDPEVRKEGATFDRFGFFPCGGGGRVQIFFDDLKYTATRADR